MSPVLDNASARRFFLHKHALAESPTGSAQGAALTDLICRLGFVQLDSVRTVERAHHMILFARRQSYRPPNLSALHESGALFEHWTHDAALIPTAFYPYWRLRFARDAQTLPARWSDWQGHTVTEQAQAALDHIRAHGCCTASDLSGDRQRKSTGWWDWHPSKSALEFLWRSGQLAIARRDGFRKIYDLPDRVIPADARRLAPSEQQTIDWLCRAALDRLGFATPGEIAAFWDTLRPHEVKAWCTSALAQAEITPITILGTDGSPRHCYCFPDSLSQAKTPPDPPKRMRVLSPFDPLLRDRKRAQRLFNFHYRIEIFTPAAKRRYGYYVFPLLEGARLVGRIDMAAQRDTGALHVTALWPEAKIRWTDPRQARLEAELTRVARFAGLDHITWANNWRRATLPVPKG